MAKRVAIEVQTWTKRWDSAFDGLSEGRLEVFPMREGARLTSSVRFIGKPRNASERSSRSSRPSKPEVFTERGEALERRLRALAGDGWKCTTKRVRVPEHDAPRGRTEAEVAREQYDQEMRAMLTKGRH
jgi:hypothetical protein